jgi:hypothetical protein
MGRNCAKSRAIYKKAQLKRSLSRRDFSRGLRNPKYGSESELKKQNRAVPNFLWNSEIFGIPQKVGIPTFFGISTQYFAMSTTSL